MANEINLKDYLISKTKAPVYLEDLLEQNEDITLVFQKNKLTSNCSASNLLDSFDVTSNTTLNLTGRPLEVDLSITTNSAIGDPIPRKSSDGNYSPMSISTARKFINHYNKQLKRDFAKTVGVYCICDAFDEENTIVLGSNILTDSVVSCFLVYACDTIQELWDENIMNRMLTQHINNVEEPSPKIEVKSSSFYEVYGYKLDSSHDLETTYNLGYISIEAQWNTNEFNIPQHGALINMLLQVVIGHENSILYSIHEKLVLLQNCISNLRDSNLADDTILCNSLCIEDELQNKLSNVLHEVCYTKSRVIPQDMHQALGYIQESNLTHKLWNVLSCATNLETLKDCMNALFQMINIESARVQILDDDLTSTLGTIIKDIYEGKMIVPTLTSKQSLILLIELGLQKIEKTLIFIIRSYDLAISDSLNDHWRKLSSNCESESRVNILENLNLEIIFKKLDFLYSIYIMLEFLQIVDQNCMFTTELRISVLKHAYNKYDPCRSYLVFSETKQLLDLVLPATYNDVKLAIDYPPFKRKVKMITERKFPWYCSVTTLFHYSKKQIFPENIYKYKNAEPLSEDEQKYFLTRMETYSDKLPV